MIRSSLLLVEFSSETSNSLSLEINRCKVEFGSFMIEYNGLKIIAAFSFGTITCSLRPVRSLYNSTLTWRGFHSTTRPTRMVMMSYPPVIFGSYVVSTGTTAAVPDSRRVCAMSSLKVIELWSMLASVVRQSFKPLFLGPKKRSFSSTSTCMKSIIEISTAIRVRTAFAIDRSSVMKDCLRLTGFETSD